MNDFTSDLPPAAPLFASARQVLRNWSHFGPFEQLTLAAGGFSGAVVLRVNTSRHGEFALRGWPASYEEIDRLRELHRLLAYLSSGSLPVAVPEPLQSGETLCLVAGQLWQLEPWLPGTSITPETLTSTSLATILTTLAQLHRQLAEYRCTSSGWNWFRCEIGPVPAVQERLALLQRWSATDFSLLLRKSANNSRLLLPDAASATEYSSEPSHLAERIVTQFSRHAEAVRRQLQGVAPYRLPLHPCWRDLWNAHVLMQSQQVSGLLDAGAMRTEHVASDLSRLLGSLLEAI